MQAIRCGHCSVSGSQQLIKTVLFTSPIGAIFALIKCYSLRRCCVFAIFQEADQILTGLDEMEVIKP